MLTKFDLMGTTEVANRLGWARQHVRIYTLRAKSKEFPAGGFPQPIAELACGPIWLTSDIEAYAAERERKAAEKEEKLILRGKPLTPELCELHYQAGKDAQ